MRVTNDYQSMLLLVPTCIAAIGLGMLDALWRHAVRAAPSLSGSRSSEAP